VAQTGLIGGRCLLPTHKTPMTVSGDRDLKDGANELVIKFESPDIGGVKLVKTYTQARRLTTWRCATKWSTPAARPCRRSCTCNWCATATSPVGESSFYFTFTGPAVYTDAKKFQKVEFSDIEKNKADFEKEAANGYVAMVQHYFASAWLLGDGISANLFMRKVDTNLYSAGMITPLDSIAPGATKTVKPAFCRPAGRKELESWPRPGTGQGLWLADHPGQAAVLAAGQAARLAGQLGLVHRGLVVLLKIAFYWLNAKAYASMAKMKAINPKVMEMRERLKDNPQQMQQEMMRIYREEKVNPMGGCFPIMVQIPVFIALYWVLLSSVEMRNAPWILWITTCRRPDPFFILPLVMTADHLLQTALNPRRQIRCRPS
jgi:YidC/Oxa1 family membrane protein insertase